MKAKPLFLMMMLGLFVLGCTKEMATETQITDFEGGFDFSGIEWNAFDFSFDADDAIHIDRNTQNSAQALQDTLIYVLNESWVDEYSEKGYLGLNFSVKATQTEFVVQPIENVFEQDTLTTVKYSYPDGLIIHKRCYSKECVRDLLIIYEAVRSHGDAFYVKRGITGAVLCANPELIVKVNSYIE